jgi:hypothetical protein
MECIFSRTVPVHPHPFVSNNAGKKVTVISFVIFDVGVEVADM